MDISIIIPTYNEERSIKDLIEFLIDHSGKNAIKEVLVVDGGSDDGTVSEVGKTEAKIIPCPSKGRSVQMNTAAKHTKGEILYFVHADTRPPKGYADYIRNEIRRGEVIGCFTSIFDWPHPFLRFCNFFSRLPFWFCRGGGQTLFVKKELFNKLGGFDTSMKLMEEYDFISRAQKEANFSIIKANAITSARDYRANGAIRLQLIYMYVFFLYAIGAPQQKMLDILKKHVVNPSKSCD